MRVVLHTLISMLIVMSSPLIGFEDHDIDGVEDSLDHCPHTPFDTLVDTNGCPYDKASGKFTLQLGNDLTFNKLSDISSNLNLYANYRYDTWNFSLASSNYNLTNLNTNTSEETDLYLTVGHLFEYKKLKTKVALGTKFAFMDDKTIQRDNDYYASVNFDYYPTATNHLFFYYNHTLSGQSDDITYNDFSSFSLGTGHMFSSKWYSALSFNYSGALYANVEDYKAVSWFNAYNITKDFYVSCNYARTLNDSASEHILSLNVGVHFE